MISMRLTIMLVVALIWVGPVWGRDDGGPKYEAPPEIVATLPKICWWFYMDNIPNTPEYNIRLTCGISSNHYCPGLVHMKRVEQEKTTDARLYRLRRAKEDMEYTLRYTEKIPECSVRQSAKMTLERIKFQMDMLKWNVRTR